MSIRIDSLHPLLVPVPVHVLESLTGRVRERERRIEIAIEIGNKISLPPHGVRGEGERGGETGTLTLHPLTRKIEREREMSGLFRYRYR